MNHVSPHQQLDEMITGYWISQSIYAAAKFGIADHLKDGPKSVEELAESTSTNAVIYCAKGGGGNFTARRGWKEHPHRVALVQIAQPGNAVCIDAMDYPPDAVGGVGCARFRQ